jgi:O-antigen ligase
MSRALRLARSRAIDPLLWPLGGAVLLLFLVPTTITALVPLAIFGAVGLRRPALAVAIIPVTFPFHDVGSPSTHLHLDRTALLIIVACLAALAHATIAALPAFVPAVSGKWPEAVIGERAWTRTELRALPADVLAFFRQPGAWAALSLLMLGAFSLLTVADAEFRGNSVREFRMTILFPVVWFLLAAAVFERSERRPVLLKLLWLGVDAAIVSGVIIALIAYFQFARGSGLGVEGVRRVRSVFRHPNELALYLGRIVPVAAALALFGPRGWRTWAYLTATLIMLGAVGLSFSRGGYLGIAVALFVILCATGKTRLIWGYVVIFVAASVAAFATGIERFTSLIHPASGSDGLRLDIWHSAADMLRDHPAWGVGLDQFISQYPHYIRPSAWQERFTAHPHNIVLDFYVRLGLLGLAWLVFTLPPFIVRGWRAARRRMAEGDALRFALAIGATGALVDFTVHGMVDQDYFLHMLAYGFWSAVLIIRICALDRPTDVDYVPPDGIAIRQHVPPLRAAQSAPLAGEGHPV